MGNSYAVSDVAVDETEAFLRVATLKSGGASYSSLSVSLDRRFPGKSDAPGTHAMNEVYLPMDTATIEAVDGNPDKQEQFLRSHARSVDGSHVNLCLVNYLLAPGEKPSVKNLAYLNDLLLWSRNHVYLPPTITFDRRDKRPQEDRVELYDTFVKDLLALKNQTVPGNLRVGITVPRFYPRRSLAGLEHLFSHENDAPAFVCLDFANSKLGTPSLEQKVVATHRLFRTQDEEAYFVYGMRVRPRQKGPPPACAEDITTLMSGLNAIGRPHRDFPFKMVLPPFTWESMVSFHSSRYEYDGLLADRQTLERFRAYLDGQYIDIPDFAKPAKPEDKRYGVHVSNFSRRELNIEGSNLASEVRGADTKAIRKRLAGKEAARRAKTLVRGL